MTLSFVNQFFFMSSQQKIKEALAGVQKRLLCLAFTTSEPVEELFNTESQHRIIASGQ